MFKTKGFGLVEALIGVSIFSIALLAMIISFSNLSSMQNRLTERMQAQFLLEEGVEAVKNIRDNDWMTISDADSLTEYTVSFDDATNSFVLISGAETIDLFERSVVFEDVSRNSSGEVDESGSNDEGTKKVTVTVTWLVGGVNQQKELVTYITDLFTE